MFFTGDEQVTASSKRTKDQKVQFMVHVTGLSSSKPKYKVIENLAVPNPISGARYHQHGQDKLIFVAFGYYNQDPPGGVYAIDPYPPYHVTPWTTSFGEYPYDGPDDATVLPDGSVWFTDLVYASMQGLKPTPEMPSQVYRYDPVRNTTRAMLDQLDRPNGIAHSPDGKVLYVSDTGANVVTEHSTIKPSDLSMPTILHTRHPALARAILRVHSQ